MVGWVTTRLRRSWLVQSILRGPRVFPIPSLLRFLTLQLAGGRAPKSWATVPLAVRWFDGQMIRVRPGGSDWETVHTSLLGRYHRPPADLVPVRTILDLGANIGVTVGDLAARYPEARILGVELDADNVRLARRNTERWADRTEILHGAVWTDDGTIRYGGTGGEDAYRVLPALPPSAPADAVAEVNAHSMTSLIERLSPGGVVDYVKMDVEGTEPFLLAEGNEWADRVCCLKVELHRPFDVAACTRELRRLGFAARQDPTGIACVIGRRPADDAH